MSWEASDEKYSYSAILDKMLSKKEWGELVDKYKPDEVFKEIGGFKWNLHDVCLNPKISFEYGEDKIGKPHLIIKTAMTAKNFWVVGIRCSCGMGGGLSSPVLYTVDKSYTWACASHQEALMVGFARAIDSIMGDIAWHTHAKDVGDGVIKRAKDFLEIIKNERYKRTYKELSLWE